MNLICGIKKELRALSYMNNYFYSCWMEDRYVVSYEYMEMSRHITSDTDPWVLVEYKNVLSMMENLVINVLMDKYPLVSDQRLLVKISSVRLSSSSSGKNIIVPHMTLQYSDGMIETINLGETYGSR